MFSVAPEYTRKQFQITEGSHKRLGSRSSGIYLDQSYLLIQCGLEIFFFFLPSSRKSMKITKCEYQKIPAKNYQADCRLKTVLLN